jgi:SAM-dependent methyltransferase
MTNAQCVGALAERWETSREATLIYDRELVPVLFGPWAEDLVERARLQSGERVLDLACGSGAVALLAARCVGSGGRVCGLDRNPEMLGCATARSREAHLAIDWRLGSAESLPFDDASFDVVLCQQGFQFFADRGSAVREVARVLRPGGRVLATVWNEMEHNPLIFAFVKALLSLNHGWAEAMRRPFSMSDGKAVESLFQGACDIVRLSKVRLFLTVKDLPKFVRSFIAALPFAEELDASGERKTLETAALAHAEECRTDHAFVSEAWVVQAAYPADLQVANALSQP